MTVVHAEGASTLAIRDDQSFFSEHQIAALRQLGVGDATNGDLAVFFHQCQRTGLDPFARQVYMVGRWSREGTKYTIQTGIDGFRLIGRRAADAARETLEVSDTEWCGEDGIWRDVWLSPEAPAAARVAVIRNGGRFPAVALFREYAQTKKDGSLTQMWADKGVLMIAKCAEALAWRKAFPQDLSGLYTADEMSRADHADERPKPPPVPQRASAADLASMLDTPEPEAPATSGDKLRSEAQMRKLWALAKECDLGKGDDFKAYLSQELGRAVESTKDITAAEAHRLIEQLESLGAPIEAELVDPVTGEVAQ